MLVDTSVEKRQKMMMRQSKMRLTRGWAIAWCLSLIGIAVLLAAAPAQGAFGVVPGSFSAAPTDLQAGAHSDFEVEFRMREEQPNWPEGTIRDLRVDLPPGLVGDPTVVERCTMSRVLTADIADKCPRRSAVGWATVEINRIGPQAPSTQTIDTPVFSIAPGASEPAAFGFKALVLPVRMGVTVDPSGEYRLSVRSESITDAARLVSIRIVFWGVPGDYQGPGTLREFGSGPRWFGGPLVDEGISGPVAGNAARRPFMVNPASCDGAPMRSTISARSWEDGIWTVPEVAEAPAIEGCERLQFAPTIRVTGDTRAAGAPVGVAVDLTVPQSTGPDALATPPLKDAVVTMPEGMAISPSGADGLGACTDTQLGLGSTEPERCPDSAKLGTVAIDTPLLEQPLLGSVYLGSQLSGDPRSGEMVRLFLTAYGSGVRIKLRGAIEVDPATGRLTARFVDNPQLPFSQLRLRFKGGPRSPLVNPTACGTWRAQAQLSSWAGQHATATDTITVDQGCDVHGFSPRFTAGVAHPVGGAESPFNLVVARQDGDGFVKTIKSVRLPEGLLARVASVPLCLDAQAAAGTCPEASRVGHVQIAAGAGSQPFWLPEPGKQSTGVYLTGPYGGAPYGLSINVPAQAGPLDLGRVVVRLPLHVDERTAAITSGVDETRLIDTNGTVTDVLSEALPRILKGIVLGLREIRLVIDREGFMINPTDCSQKRITAEIYSYEEDQVDVGNRFRVVDCALLGFKPKFRAKILDKGRKSTLRSFHPRTRFTVVPRKGDANIGGARIALPSSVILDQANIGTTCTRQQMADKACPAGSVVGYARAWSPLLRKAVEGPVYLAANGGVRPLPDLAAVMDGEIRIVLQGEIATRRGGGKARLQNTFRVVPDAPVNRFVLTMLGGAKRGLLVNSADLCRSRERGVALFIGQNGKRHRLHPRVATTFRGCAKVRRQVAQRKQARWAAARSAAREVR